MELRYCEMCGEIIKLQGNSETLEAGAHVCERCASKQQSVPAPVKKKAEDIAFRPDAAEREGSPTGGVASEITLQQLLAGSELDLYSPDTLARRKASHSPAEPEKPRAVTKIKLLDPDAPAAQSGTAAAPRTLHPGPAAGRGAHQSGKDP